MSESTTAGSVEAAACGARDRHASPWPIAARIARWGLQGLAISVCALSVAAARPLDCAGSGPCLQSDTGLPARVLMRPAARLHAAPDPAAEVTAGNLQPFHPWFIFEEKLSASGEPWRRVGLDPATPRGWVAPEDAIPWRSAIVVTYAHPGARYDSRRAPVLMFDSLDNLRRLADAPDPSAYAADLFGAIMAGDVAAFSERGVVSMEPRRFVDFRRGFYILPVLDFERLPLFDSEARLLKLAAAVPPTKTDLGRGESRLSDPSIRRSIVAGDTVAGTEASSLAVEIKFVIDMTASMQPYLDAVRRAVARLADHLATDGLDAEFRFGLVGYTDVPSQCGRCHFVKVHDFFPQGAVDAARLIDVLRHDAAARGAGGGDWPESMFEGVEQAVNGPWTANALKFVVLIGDAGANDFGGPKNPSVSLEGVRALADASNVTIIALHAKPLAGAAGAPILDQPPTAEAAAESALPRASDSALAEAHFGAISQNPGRRKPAYLSISVNPEDASLVRRRSEEAIYGLAERFAAALAAVRGGDANPESAPGEGGPAPDASLETLAQETFSAALISYLGAPAARPRDLTFWSLDVDPIDFVTPALEVRVLLEKRELETLIITLESIHSAFVRAKAMDSMDFFEQLQTTVAATALDGRIDHGAVRSLAGSGVVPAWLKTLPYRSQILDLTPERFADMSAGERDRLEQALLRKLAAYRDLYASDDWFPLWPGAGELDRVYPVLLSDLP